MLIGLVLTRIDIHLSSTPATEETVLVERVYVSDLRQLTLTCLEASQGECRIGMRLNGHVRLVRFNPGGSRRLSGMPAGAAVCSGGPDLAPDTCAWQPIGGATS